MHSYHKAMNTDDVQPASLGPPMAAPGIFQAWLKAGDALSVLIHLKKGKALGCLSGSLLASSVFLWTPSSPLPIAKEQNQIILQ